MVIPQRMSEGIFSIVGSFPSVTFWIWRVRIFLFQMQIGSIPWSSRIWLFRLKISLAFARAAMELEDAHSQWDARDGEIMMEIENYSQHIERIRQIRWARKGFFFNSGDAICILPLSRTLRWMKESTSFFLWTRSSERRHFAEQAKTQWIGWLNWGFRSWPLIRWVTRKSKSRSRKGNSGFFRSENSTRDDGCAKQCQWSWRAEPAKK